MRPCPNLRQRRILGSLKDGQPFYVIKGAEPDDEENERNDSEEGSEGQDDGDDSGDSGDGDGEAKKPRIYTEDEVGQLMKRLSGADKARTDAEKRIKEYEDKDKSELEKAQRDLAEANARGDAAEKALVKTRIHNKFLASNKYNWHDPETALALLDLGELEVEDNGKVKGLEAAIDALAKAKPFLVNGDDDGKGKKENGGGGGRPSGGQPPANKGGKDRDKDRARLLEKYPNLNR